MRIVFAERSAGPEPLLCEVEVVFDDPGPLAGLKLVGFMILTEYEARARSAAD